MAARSSNYNHFVLNMTFLIELTIFILTLNRWISYDLLKILKKMLRSDESKRISLEDILKEPLIKETIQKIKAKEKERYKIK